MKVESSTVGTKKVPSLSITVDNDWWQSKCSYLWLSYFNFYLLSNSPLLPLNDFGLVVWGWGLWTDKSVLTLPVLHSGLQIIITGLNFGQLSHILDNQLKNRIWLLEKQHRQIIAANSDRTSNWICLNDAFTSFSRFLYIHIYKILI